MQDKEVHFYLPWPTRLFVPHTTQLNTTHTGDAAMYHAETQAALSATLNKAREQIAESDRDAAARRYIEAKRKEEAAKLERLAAEAEILRLFGAKEEGSQTVKSELFAV